MHASYIHIRAPRLSRRRRPCRAPRRPCRSRTRPVRCGWGPCLRGWLGWILLTDRASTANQSSVADHTERSRRPQAARVFRTSQRGSTAARVASSTNFAPHHRAVGVRQLVWQQHKVLRGGARGGEVFQREGADAQTRRKQRPPEIGFPSQEVVDSGCSGEKNPHGEVLLLT